MSEKRLLSLMILFLGIAIFLSYHIYYHFVDTSNSNSVKNYFQKVKNESSNQEMSVKKIISNNETENYAGVLIIPKINLKTGFYDKNSKKNNVDNSVTLLKESIMPNNSNSVVYLAAHSGVGHLAFFKKIINLTIEDIIFLNYDNKEFPYTVTDVYEMPKNGNISINRNINENYLVLTTCSKNENMQLVIVSKMLNLI